MKGQSGKINYLAMNQNCRSYFYNIHMFKKIKQNWRRKLLGGLSLTSALFIFQACYGTPHDMGLDIFI
jgi:hypothetical protein